jgi:hypothetical protein
MTRLITLITLFSLVSAGLAACGQQPKQSKNPKELARSVAQVVRGDCLKARSDAPDAAYVHHLERLCTCAYNKIAASAMPADDETQGNRIIAAAAQACNQRVGAEPTARDYRAAGMPAPEGLDW